MVKEEEVKEEEKKSEVIDIEKKELDIFDQEE